MKKRRNFVEKVKQMDEQHINAIKITGSLMFFIFGFLVSWSCIGRSLNDSQFEFLEKVARDVYAQEGKVIVEVPKNVAISKTTTTITVELDGLFSPRGKVTARLQNGELVMTRDLETIPVVIFNSCIGWIFVCVFRFILAFLQE